jgi:hemolysin activation/secretion protein
MALVAGLSAAPATADPAAPSSPGFDPRQTEQRFDAWQRQQSHGRPPLHLPRFGAAPAPAAGKPLFVLNGVVVTGARTLSADDLAGAWRSYLGRSVSAADLAAIAGAISELYRARGYHLSRAIVPPQDVDGGRVRIQVIEGAITDIAIVSGDAARFGAAPMLAAICAERPSRLDTLERQLLLLGDRPGVRIADTALEEIGPLSGRFRLTVTLDTWTTFAAFGLDDLGSRPIGPWQSYATFGFNSLLAPGDALTLNVATVPNDPRELAFSRLSYDVPVGTDGFRLGASVVASEVRPGDERRQFNDITRTESAEIRASLAVLESQAAALTLTTAFGATNAWEANSFGAVYNDYVRTISFSADGRLHDGFGGTTFVTASWRQGLPAFGASDATDVFTSRFGAPADFGVFDGFATRYQALVGAVSLKLSGAVQFATAPLLLSQQFYLGGLSFGRGYGNAEVSGDNALAGSAELRFDHGVGWQYLKTVQFYGFVDSGAVWDYGFGIGSGVALTSAGGGIRFFLWDELKAVIGVAFPLTYRSPYNPDRTAQVLFSLSTAFRTCAERAEMRCL